MGPLTGVKVIEFAGLGPGPHAAMLLADLGATVLRIERPAGTANVEANALRFEVVKRNRSAISLDTKTAEGRDLARALINQADALIEGFRPGVMERMGLGPKECLERNPTLVYGRMTGWGQDGPLAYTAGHDLNYIALTGALDAIGRAGLAPTPPLNLVGDYGGGALYLALGLVSALFESRQSGKGQIVDAAMVDGAASLMAKPFGLWAAGLASGSPVGSRGTNLLDSGAFFYDVYQCADNRWLAVAAIEQQFYTELLQLLQLNASDVGDQWDRANWPRAKAILAARIREKSLAEWSAIFEDTDACVAPVLTVGEAHTHPHLQARKTIVEIDGVMQPAPAPRFSRTQLDTPAPPKMTDSDRAAVLREWGISPNQA
jgi:alpha-methylacyl-CoA racemase